MNSPDSLALALSDCPWVRDIRLKRQNAGQLILPSGRLVACDPIVGQDVEPFDIPLNRGCFEVVLTVAEFANGDQRVAFAAVRLGATRPAVWDMLTIGDQNLASLKANEIFGYPVDSGTGCFLDAIAARSLTKAVPDFNDILIRELDKTYRHAWSWANVKLGDANIVAFSSGDGDGFYATYAGYDDAGEVSAVVTDFCML